MTEEENKPPYGYCPVCNEEGQSRERRPNGNDTCRNGHTYPSAKALENPVYKTDKELYVKALEALMPIFCDVDISYSFQRCDSEDNEVFARTTWFPETITFGKWNEVRSLIQTLALEDSGYWTKTTKEEMSKDYSADKYRQLMGNLKHLFTTLQKIEKEGDPDGNIAREALKLSTSTKGQLADAFKPAIEAAKVISDLWLDYAPLAGHAQEEIELAAKNPKEYASKRREGDETPTEYREAITPALEAAESWLRRNNLGGLYQNGRRPRDRMHEAESANEVLKRKILNLEYEVNVLKRQLKEKEGEAPAGAEEE